MSTIAAKFAELKQENQIGLIPYVTVGFPDLAATLEIVPALVAGGADMVELGVPFSDPLADGTTIQRSGFRALEQGVTLEKCLEAAGALRKAGVKVPLLPMGYYNPILSYGIEAFARRAAAAGVDGIIVPDLPPEEAAPLRQACMQKGIDVVFLLAPTSTEERIARVAALSSGFVYCVSLIGITGARPELSPTLAGFVARVRRHTTLPIAVGFGISRREHLEAISGFADAAVVGSALIDIIERAPRSEVASRAQNFVQELAQGKGRLKERREVV